LRLFLSLLGIAIGLLGLGLDWVEIVPGVTVASETNPVARSFVDALVWFWSYFTHLTNLGLVLVYLAVVTNGRLLSALRSPFWMASMGGYILLVMLYYHFMLSGLYEFEGGLLVATIVLHYVAPIYFLLWWAVFAPHGSLSWRQLPLMLIPGLVYVAWALIRGAVVGEYPYDILDAGKFGYGAVAAGVAVLVVAVTIFCLAMIGADKLMARTNAVRAA
jgi:hypothetical protein